MNSLENLIELATSSNNMLTDVLRHAKILASQLENSELETWISNELDGYSDVSLLPDYRVFNGQPRGDFLCPFGNRWSNFPILPPPGIPEALKRTFTEVKMRWGIRVFESLIRESEGQSNPKQQIRQDLVEAYADEFMPDCVCVQAWIPVPVNILEGALDTVRNRLLDLILRLRSIAPRGDIGWSTPKPDATRVQQVVYQTVLQDAQYVSIGGALTQQISVMQEVSPGDLDSLWRVLETVGVGGDQFDDLKAAIEDDSLTPTSDGLGLRVRKWLGRLTEDSVSGAVKSAASVVSSVAAQAVLRYYGLI